MPTSKCIWHFTFKTLTVEVKVLHLMAIQPGNRNGNKILCDDKRFDLVTLKKKDVSRIF